MSDFFKNKVIAITGGSEEVIADLAVRQAVGQADRLRKKSDHAKMLSRL